MTGRLVRGCLLASPFLLGAVGCVGGPQVGSADGSVNGLANTVTRSWTPKGAPATNPNYYIPQCDLTNVLANGDCGTVSDTNFGKPTLSTTSDPSTKTGWGNRPYQWEFSTSVQQELTKRVSVNVGYFRRWLGNFNVVDNLALTPSDFDAFTRINGDATPSGCGEEGDQWSGRSDEE